MTVALAALCVVIFVGVLASARKVEESQVVYYASLAAMGVLILAVLAIYLIAEAGPH